MSDSDLPHCASLHEHARRLRAMPLLRLFEADPGRAATLAFEWEDWYADLSKLRLDAAALTTLVDCAHARNLAHWIAALFAGEKINQSEQRAALHPALRAPASESVVVDGVDVVAQIAATRARMEALCRDLRSGARRGASGRALTQIVHLGIGGSHLGPLLVCDALDALATAGGDGAPNVPSVRFVSNVDPAELARAVAGIDPAETLFVVASKSFTTVETLANAHAARAWLERDPAIIAGASKHFIAVTASVAEARRFGVADDAILPMPEEVGGRYSLWSAVGISAAARLGWPAFARLLDGAHRMDVHFRTAPLARNLPVVLALAGWWNARWLGHEQRIVVPYARALAHLPAWLQQLELESNGKSVTRDGAAIDGPTAPTVWGGAGTDSQHSFFQWLHQGGHEVPVEFIVPVAAAGAGGALLGDAERQRMLVANALAQAEALMCGRDGEPLRRELASQGLEGTRLEAGIAARRCPGNRASMTLLIPRLDPRALGALLALYEHRTFVEAIMYGVNPFDQWGVEIGKALAKPIEAALAGRAAAIDGTDASTRRLVERARRLMHS
ncbi:MAG: glucose-6-phosphate isomerase [Proteobacteria bacterium]|jgi:glucose-6-phosphate isomerase|nr:glucose-6-phosphate isomerase [Pseudomonadota bacterium]